MGYHAPQSSSSFRFSALLSWFLSHYYCTAQLPQHRQRCCFIQIKQNIFTSLLFSFYDTLKNVSSSTFIMRTESKIYF